MRHSLASLVFLLPSVFGKSGLGGLEAGVLRFSRPQFTGALMFFFSLTGAIVVNMYNAYHDKSVIIIRY